MGGDINPSVTQSRRHGRGGALLFVDLIAFAVSINAALVIRFGAAVPYEHQIPYLYFWPVLLVWRVFCAGAFDLYDFRRRLS